MGVDELLNLREAVHSALSQRSAELKEQLRRLDGSWSSTTRRHAYGGRSLKGVKLPPKYRDPQDQSLIWAGRGARPRWMEERIKAGAKQEDFLIGESKKKIKSRKAKSTKTSAKAKARKAA
jgi:DNA-binding protein H-NS